MRSYGKLAVLVATTIVSAVFVVFGAVDAGARALAAQPQAGQEEVQKAIQLVNEGKLQEGLVALDKILEDDPQNWFAHLHRGRALGMMGNNDAARQEFLKVAEINPLIMEAYRMAFIASYQLGDYESAWIYLVRAQQGGLDMSQAMEVLRQAASAPPGIDTQLDAPRIFVVEEINAAAAAARIEGVTVDQRDSAADVAEAGERTTGRTETRLSGVQFLAENQAELYEVVRQTRMAIGESMVFGLVANQENATYILQIDADEFDEGSNRLGMRGYLKLINARDGEEAHRRPIELRNLRSVPSLKVDMQRYVERLEEWLGEEGG